MDITKKEKEYYCTLMAEELPIIRKMLSMSQADLAQAMDLARATVSSIEYKKKMTWTQYTAILFIVFSNDKVRNYVFEQNLCSSIFKDFYSKIKAC